MTGSKVDSQSDSRLLSAPLEVRREIYSHFGIDNQIHLVLHEGRLRMSVCLEPSLGDNICDGRERRTTYNLDYSDVQWARRLASLWGPHWECEENATRINSDKNVHHISDLRLVCKKMFLDVFDLITVTVTDLNTLDYMTTRKFGLETNSSCRWNVWEYMQCRVKSLNITLRLPLAVYKALEEREITDPMTATSPTTTVASMCSSWFRIWASIFKLQQLQNIHIWLDHDDPSSWSVVKEKLILGYVFTKLEQETQARASKISCPQLNVMFNLPKLHPGIAKAETHFVKAMSPPSFNIERRYRLRYYYITSDDGTLSVKHSPDFPILTEIAEYYANEELGEQMMTYEESEEEEKNMWLRGMDVEQEGREIMAALEDFFVCY